MFTLTSWVIVSTITEQYIRFDDEPDSTALSSSWSRHKVSFLLPPTSYPARTAILVTIFLCQVFILCWDSYRGRYQICDINFKVNSSEWCLQQCDPKHAKSGCRLFWFSFFLHYLLYLSFIITANMSFVFHFLGLANYNLSYYFDSCRHDCFGDMVPLEHYLRVSGLGFPKHISKILVEFMRK